MSTAAVLKGGEVKGAEFKGELKGAEVKGNEKTETGLRSYYVSKIQELTVKKEEKQRNWERLRAQRNELNMRGKCCLSFISDESIITIQFLSETCAITLVIFNHATQFNN